MELLDITKRIERNWDKSFDELSKTKFGKFILFLQFVFGLVFLIALVWGFCSLIGNWFLNLSIIEFSAISILILLCCFRYAGKTLLCITALVFIVDVYTLKVMNTRDIEFYTSINHKYYFTLDRWINNYVVYANSLSGNYHSYDFDLITLGESWCYLRDYQGNICENYIIYVENKKEVLSAKWNEKRANDTTRYELQKAKVELQESIRNENLQRYENIITNYKGGQK